MTHLVCQRAAGLLTKTIKAPRVSSASKARQTESFMTSAVIRLAVAFSVENDGVAFSEESDEDNYPLIVAAIAVSFKDQPKAVQDAIVSKIVSQAI